MRIFYFPFSAIFGGLARPFGCDVYIGILSFLGDRDDLNLTLPLCP